MLVLVLVLRNRECNWKLRRTVHLDILGHMEMAVPLVPLVPVAPTGPNGSGSPRGRATAARRRARQQEIVASTRRLFDARGMRSANIDDISRAVGINRAIIYRHFASKEELFALTLAEYLTELDGLLSTADDPSATPKERFAAVAREFAGYCLRYPAFVDCALALLGRPGPDLLGEISDSALIRLGGLMGTQLHRIAGLLRQGRDAGDDRAGRPADDEDADVLANALYMQVLGVMHLARSGVVLRPSASGQVTWMMVGEGTIIDMVTRMAVAVAFPAPSSS
jgi:AcrR family transcriptional regulator